MNLTAKKIEIIVPKEKSKDLLEELQNLGLTEIISGGTKDRELEGKYSREKEDLELKLANVNFARNFLKNFERKENFLRDMVRSFVPLKSNFAVEELKKLAGSSEIKEVIKNSSELEERINKLKIEKEVLSKEVDILEKFLGTSIASVKEDYFKKTNYFVGYLKREKKENFTLDLGKENKTFFIEWGEGDSLNLSFILIYSKEFHQYFKKLLDKYETKEEKVFWEKTPAESLRERKRQLLEIGSDIVIQSERAQKLAYNISNLEALIDWFNWELEKYTSFEIGRKTKNYFFLKVWAIKEAIPILEEKVGKISPYFLLEELLVLEGENPPVILKNKGLVDSFGVVTNIYGLPKPEEPDPTPYLAPFFALFFGLALSDAGYGLLLIIFPLIAKKLLKGLGVDRFLNLFIIGGIVTVLAGVFTGTFFGTELIAKYRLIDPMVDPIGTLLVILALGAFQIFVGLLIGMIWSIKKGNFKEGLGSKGGSVVFFMGVFLFALTNLPIFIFIGLGLLFLMNIVFSTAENVFLKVISGAGAIYGVVGYFSDILSYSRLLALGLATGIIGMVINMIALLFKDMVPVPGLNWLIAFIVLVFGHTANLVINTLGAFIHSTRLQFVEFFSKFMEGGGKCFKPLNKKGRFVKIIN